MEPYVGPPLLGSIDLLLPLNPFTPENFQMTYMSFKIRQLINQSNYSISHHHCLHFCARVYDQMEEVEAREISHHHCLYFCAQVYDQMEEEEIREVSHYH